MPLLPRGIQDQRECITWFLLDHRSSIKSIAHPWAFTRRFYSMLPAGFCQRSFVIFLNITSSARGKNIKKTFGRFYFKFSPQYVKLNKIISPNCKSTSRYFAKLWINRPGAWPRVSASAQFFCFLLFCWEHEEAGHRYLQVMAENSRAGDLNDYFFTCPWSPLL